MPSNGSLTNLIPGLSELFMYRGLSCYWELSDSYWNVSVGDWLVSGVWLWVLDVVIIDIQVMRSEKSNTLKIFDESSLRKINDMNKASTRNSKKINNICL